MRCKTAEQQIKSKDDVMIALLEIQYRLKIIAEAVKGMK